MFERVEKGWIGNEWVNVPVSSDHLDQISLIYVDHLL